MYDDDMYVCGNKNKIRDVEACQVHAKCHAQFYKSLLEQNPLKLSKFINNEAFRMIFSAFGMRLM